MPKRIQRRRVKGWQMPDNAVSVTRPLAWGNPFRVGHHYKRGGGGIARLGLQFIYTEAYEGYQDNSYSTIKTPDEAVEWFKWYVSTWNESRIAKLRSELGGKDLACWCKSDAPCHADILLAIANP
jgi:hypothetical protein